MNWNGKDEIVKKIVLSLLILLLLALPGCSKAAPGLAEA